MLEKLDGWKTHISTVLAVLWVFVFLKIPGAKDAIGVENFGCVLMALIGSTVLAGRAALAKVHGAASEAAENTAPKAGAP